MSSPQPSRTRFNAPDRVIQTDAISDPEPPVPPLAEPDPGVFHHEPSPAPQKSEHDRA